MSAERKTTVGSPWAGFTHECSVCHTMSGARMKGTYPPLKMETFACDCGRHDWERLEDSAKGLPRFGFICAEAT